VAGRVKARPVFYLAGADYKPVFVPLRAIAIRLGHALLRGSCLRAFAPDCSDLPGSLTERAAPPPLFGLAPRGVCPAGRITPPAVRSYRTISPLPAPLLRDSTGGIFSVALSVKTPLRGPPRPLAGTLPFGDRTFLSPGLNQTGSERLSIRRLPVFSLSWRAVRCSVGTRTLMTVAEFEKMPDDGNLHELDKGELIVMQPPGWMHGIVQGAVAEALRQAARKAGSGIVVTECGFRLAPDVVHAPDVAFIRKERRTEMVPGSYCEFSPDLAIEIVARIQEATPDDNAARLLRKIDRYLAAGTSIVWVMNPDSVTVTICRKSGVFRTLTADELIDAPELLPGFSIQVRTLFE
jgi:Uma2 family endonuclease